MGRSWAWLVDRTREGKISAPVTVDPHKLPTDALPKPNVRLHPESEVLLRVRLTGEKLVPGRVPASIVKRAVENSTTAVKTLVTHALSLHTGTGRPAESLRRFYDLPAIDFAFKSFEVAFGLPEPLEQPELDQTDPLENVRDLLSKGLTWAAAVNSVDPEHTSEWSAITDALSKLAPPHTGAIDLVEVSGVLAGTVAGEPVRLTKKATERIAAARKFLTPDRRARTHEGYVREFDKDKLTFILRGAQGDTIQNISVTENQYDDALLAFERDEPVTLVCYEAPRQQIAELISITFTAPPEEEMSLD